MRYNSDVLRHLLRIAVFLGLSGAAGRRVARGVRAFAHDRPWVFQFRTPQTTDFASIADWRPHGVITEVWGGTDATIRALARRVPVVETAGALPELPGVAVDDEASGRMAARYFVSRGFRRFASVWANDEPYAVARHRAFREEIARLGHELHAFDAAELTRRLPWPKVEARLQAWVAKLPKPIALLADNDGQALRVLEAARQAGVHVPEQMAVLGVDDDELLCGLSQPSLSSIAQPFEQIGYAAAEMLDALLRKRKIAKARRRMVVPPVRVVTRHSTDAFAIEDPEVAGAMRFIRDHAHEPIRVTDILGAVPVSRRALERKFVRSLGRTVLEEIHRAHVEKAKELLLSTDFAMPVVARGSGFSNERRLTEVFGRATGASPMAWRKSHRLTA